MTEFKKWLDHNKLYLEAAYKVLDMEEYTLRAWELAQPQWQPFETAPKDGTQYLLSMGGRLIICWWCTKIDALVYAGKVIEPARPWLWMPLPEVPQGDKK